MLNRVSGSGNLVGTQRGQTDSSGEYANSGAAQPLTVSATGDYKLIVMGNGFTPLESVQFTVSDATTASSLEVVPSSLSHVAGTSFSVDVLVKDSIGNTLAAYSTAVSVTMSDNNSAGPDPAPVTPSTGTVTIAGLIINSTGIFYVEATSGALTGISPAITVTYGTLTTISIDNIEDSNLGVNVPVVGRLLDQYNNPFTVASQSILDGSTSKATTDANGEFSYNEVYTSAGSKTISLTSGAVSGTSNTFEIATSKAELSLPADTAVATDSSFQYTIYLKQQPAASVTVTPASTETRLTLPSPLTFTTANYDTPQTVTVNIGSGYPRGTTTVTITNALSTSDVEYESCNEIVSSAGSFDITVFGNTDAAILFSEAPVLKENESGSYKIQLTKTPSSAVDVTVVPPTGITVTSGSPASLTSTTAATITVRAENGSGTANGVTSLAMSHTVVTSDTEFNNAFLFPSPFNVYVVDSSDAAILISETVVVQEGRTGSYSIILTKEPQSPVSVSLSISNANIQLSPSVLTFTANNYKQSQYVTITAAQSAVGGLSYSTIVTHTVTSADATYNGLVPTPAAAITVTVIHPCTAGNLAYPPGTGTCEPCPQGYKCPTLYQDKVACETTEYSPLGVWNCLDCPAGHSCSGSGMPVPCPIGSTAQWGAGVCTSCSGAACDFHGFGLANTPPGSYLATPVGLPHICPAGYACEGGNSAPSRCSSGTYAPPGSSECRTCPAEHYCPRPEISLPIPCEPHSYAGTGETFCHYCPPGYSCDATSSTACLATQESLEGWLECLECDIFCQGGYLGKCQLGEYYVDETTCNPCDEGYECDGVRKKPCPPGFFSAAGASACTPCALGTYTNDVAQNACSTISGGVGFISNKPNVGEEGCPRGTTPNGDQTACVSCTAGQYCDDPASPTTCEAGYYCNPVTLTQFSANTRTPCPGGFFNSDTGSDGLGDCSSCSDGKYCLIGSASEEDCPKGHYCLHNTHMPDTFPCPEGTYRDSTGGINVSSCTAASAGKYSPYGGQQLEFSCPRGTYCPGNEGFLHYCAPGTTSPSESDDTTDCIACVEGKWCPPGSGELNCPYGTFNKNDNGGFVWDACTKCTAGFACPKVGESTDPVTACQPGYACPEGTEYPDQYPCEPGTQSNNTDNEDLYDTDDCASCTAGTFCREGSTSTSSEKCPRGHYCEPGTKQSHQTPCAAGTYLWDVSQIHSANCAACPVGRYCARGTEKISDYCAQGHFCPLNSERPDGNPCASGTYTESYELTAAGECTACPEGSFCWAGSPTHYKCPRGTYRSTLNAQSPTDCTQCSGGQYCPEGSTSETPCSAGTMSAAGSYECEPCTAGYYCTSGTDSASKPVCSAGFYCPEGTAVAPTSTSYDCPQGFYCEEGTSEPVPCPAGTYGAATKLEDEGDCTPATVGFYAIEGATSDTGKCEPGYYCEAGSKGPFATPCPAGKFNRDPGGTGLSSCVNCTPGYYCQLGTAEPIICPSGYFCIESSSEPALCPKGTAGSVQGLTASAECTPCTSGSYCSQTGLLVSDGYCTQGYQCTAGAITGTSGAVCSAGGYCEPGFPTKRSCPPGSYNPDEGGKDLSWCRPCSQGKFCKGDESDISGPANDCLAGYYCGVSSYWSKQNIAYPGKFTEAAAYQEEVCQPGFYNPLYNQSSCTSCPEGFYCPEKEMTEPTPCDLGKYCVAGVSQPTNCEEGTYNPRLTAASATDCLKCPPGFYCPTEGLVSITTAANSCEPGYWCKESGKLSKPSSIDLIDGNSGPCPGGHYCEIRTAEAVPCPSGTYQASTLSVALIDCGSCDAGKYCTDAGSTAVQGDCEAGFYCPTGTRVPRPADTVSELFRCTYGEKCETGSSDPTPCPAGTYQDKEMQSTCANCPAGFFCPEGTGDFMSNPCPTGSYCPGDTESGTQYLCPNGTYNPRTGLTSETQCLDCPPGYYCPTPGMTTFSAKCKEGYFCKSKSFQEEPQSGVPGDNTGGKCTAGYYCPEGSAYALECDGGSYCAGEKLAAPTAQCAAGYYCIGKATSARPTDGTSGNQCPAGHYCPVGSSAPYPCPPGTYSGAVGNIQLSDCLNCQAGQYCGGAGLSEPSGPCAAGYYCPSLKPDTTEARNKVPMPADFKCGTGEMCEEGSSEATQCSAGYYQDETLQSECKTCPAGFYCPSTGMDTPTICSAGNYCGERSSAETPCIEGYYSQLDKRQSFNDCVLCPPGKYCENEGNVNPTGDCQQGYYCIGGATKAAPDSVTQGGICSIGNYCPTGSARERKCLPGRYCGTTGLAAATDPCDAGYYCKEGAQSAQPTLATEGGICPRGHYCPQQSEYPIPCPIGTYQGDEGKTQSSDCVSCLEGFYCAELGAVAVTGACAAGYYCPTGTKTSTPEGNHCTAGNYCPSGAATPQTCPSGQYQSKIGQTSCDICPAGHYCDTSTPTVYTQCTQGHYCPAGVDENGLIKCNGGNYQPFPGQSSCIQCPPGTFCASGSTALTTTTVCPMNYYCEAGSSEGTLCPDGTYGTQTGLQRKDQCTQCEAGKYCQSGIIQGDCDAGFLCESGSNRNQPDSFTNTGKAGPCPEGHYCTLGSLLPTPCPTGKFRVSTGGASEADCDVCTAGYYCIQNDPIPKSCPLGHYCPAQSEEPTPCAEGFYSLVIRATDISTCTPCPAGYYCNNTGIGDYKNYPCTPGFYCPAATAAGLTPMVESPAGRYSPGEYGSAADSLPLCPGGYYCELQSVGYKACGTGYYCPFGSSSTTDCTIGNYCEYATATTTICPAGWYCPLYNSLCTNCTEYETLTEKPPFLCSEGTICPEGSSSESACNDGAVAVKARTLSDIPVCELCKPGTYAIANNTACETCDAGHVCLEGATIQNPTDRTTQRGYICPRGYYCLAGTLEEEPCDLGKYSNNTGNDDITDCLNCESGYFNDIPASTECEQCGSFTTSTPGSSVCSCTGNNRVYLSEQQECICKTGYEYRDTNGNDRSNEHSDKDCTEKVYPRCSSSEVRDELGDCAAQDDCGNVCTESGTRTPGIGICCCKVVDDLSTVCNKDCRSAASQITITVNREIQVTDPTTGAVETTNPFSDDTFAPSCTGSLSCIAHSIVFGSGSFQGVYGAGPGISSRLRDRRLQTSSTSQVSNPVVCLEKGETLIFEVDQSNYPVYVPDSILNSNPDFDYSKFIQLQQSLANGDSVSLFAFSFLDSGTYLFQNADDSNNQLVVGVMSEEQTCPYDSANIQPRTLASLNLIGAKLSSDIILEIDWIVVIVLLVALVVSVLVFAGVFYYWAKMPWETSAARAIPYRERNRNTKVEPSHNNRTNIQLVIEGREADDSDSDKEDIMEMLFESKPQVVNYEPTEVVDDNAQIDNELINAIKEKISDNNTAVIQALDQNATDTQDRLGAISQETQELRELLEKLLDPLDGLVGRAGKQYITGFDPDDSVVEEPSMLSSAKDFQEALDEIADSSVLMEQDKQKLINELNSEFLKLERNMKDGRSRQEESLAKRLRDREARRRELARQKRELEKQTKEAQKRQNNEFWALSVDSEKEERAIEEEAIQERQQAREQLLGDPAKALREQLETQLAQNPERKQELLREYEEGAKQLESNLTINQMQQHKENLRKIEERRKKRKKDAEEAARRREEELRQQHQTEHKQFADRRRDLEVQEAIEEALPMNGDEEEEELQFLERQHKKEIDEIEQGIREEEDKELLSLTKKATIDESKFNAKKAQLERQRQKLTEEMAKSATEQDSKRYLSALQKTDAKLAEIAEQQSQQQKKNLEERLELRRKKREERLKNVKEKHRAEEEQLALEAKQRAAETKAAQLDAAIKQATANIPEDATDEAIKKLLEQKHAGERAQLQERLRKRLRKAQKELIQEKLKAKANDLESLRQEYRDKARAAGRDPDALAEVQQAEAEAINRLDYYYMKQLEGAQDSLMREGQEKAQQELLQLVDEQLAEMRTYIKPSEQGLRNEFEAKLEAERAQIEEDGRRKLEELNKRKLELENLKAQKQKELEEMIKRERGREEMAKKRDDIIKQKRELEEKQKQKRLELERKGKLNKEQIERLLNDHQKELRALDNAVTRERERQMNLLGSKLLDKKNRKIEYEDTVQRLKQEQDKWQKEMDELPGITHKQATTLLLKWRRYPKRNLRDVERSIRTQDPREKAMPVVPAPAASDTFIAMGDPKLNEIMARVQKIEGVVANVDVHQFSSIMHALEQLEKSLKNIS